MSETVLPLRDRLARELRLYRIRHKDATCTELCDANDVESADFILSLVNAEQPEDALPTDEEINERCIVYGERRSGSFAPQTVKDNASHDFAQGAYWVRSRLRGNTLRRSTEQAERSPSAETAQVLDGIPALALEQLYRKRVCDNCGAGRKFDPLRCTVCQGQQYVYEPVAPPAVYQEGVCRDHAPWKRCEFCKHIPRVKSDFPPGLRDSVRI